jgi:hypothetical protein
MIRGLKRLPEDKYIDAAKAVVEHHYDNHEYCGAWCPRKRLTEHERNLNDRYYRHKTRDVKQYVVMNTIAERLISLPRLKELCHVMDTQANESMNITISSWLALKNKCFGGSQSLHKSDFHRCRHQFTWVEEVLYSAVSCSWNHNDTQC